MADYVIPFETKFNEEFKGSVGKFILKWTTPSLLNYENSDLEINNENVIDIELQKEENNLDSVKKEQNNNLFNININSNILN